MSLSVILRALFAHVDPQRYTVAAGEAGFKTGPRSWRSLDIAIFDRAAVLAEGLTNEYVRTPPLVVIEVDTKADLRDYDDVFSYMLEKTQDLLDAGVRRVIWISTPDRKVLVAEPGKRWYVTDWGDTVEVWEDVTLNLGALLKEEGVVLEEEA